MADGEHGYEHGHEQAGGADLAARIGTLRDGGLPGLDAVGVAHVERLLERAAGLSGSARERLIARAVAYLETLEVRKDVARRRAEGEVERLERLELDPHGRARAALERGDLLSIRRMARRLPQTEVRLRDKVRKQWEVALDAEVEKRGLSSPGLIDAPSPGDLERAATLDKAVALYRDAMAAAAAELAIARAVQTLPVEAGRYHAGSVATRALQAMQDAQPYLRAQLARLETLSLLKEYGEAALRAETPQQEAAKKPKARAGKRKATRAGGRKPAATRQKRVG